MLSLACSASNDNRVRRSIVTMIVGIAIAIRTAPPPTARAVGDVARAAMTAHARATAATTKLTTRRCGDAMAVRAGTAAIRTRTAMAEPSSAMTAAEAAIPSIPPKPSSVNCRSVSLPARTVSATEKSVKIPTRTNTQWVPGMRKEFDESPNAMSGTAPTWLHTIASER